MQRDVEALYSLVDDLMSKREFDEEISRREKEYGCLLDKEAIAYLIVDELGRNKETISHISDILPGDIYTFYGKVVKMEEIREFQRKNGKEGRVAGFEVSDGTGRIRITLWDEEVDNFGAIDEDTIVKIVNGEARDGKFGTEMIVGKWGLLIIEPEDAPDGIVSLSIDEKTAGAVGDMNAFSSIIDIPPGSVVNVKGEVIEAGRVRKFQRKDGTEGRVKNITIHDGTGMAVLTFWDKKTDEVSNVRTGDMILLRNGFAKDVRNRLEIHTSRVSEITIVRSTE